MELFAKRMTWELDNDEGLSCLSFELEDGYFTLSRKTGAEALRLEMNDPANGQLIDPDCFEYALDNTRFRLNIMRNNRKVLRYLELEENGLFKKKLWGKDNLSRLPGKHGMRGKFSGDRTCLILSPIFKNDDWKGKQKVLCLSDLVLIDLAMPRGYASFHVLDVWGNRAFLSDEKDKLVLCEMTLE